MAPLSHRTACSGRVLPPQVPPMALLWFRTGCLGLAVALSAPSTTSSAAWTALLHLVVCPRFTTSQSPPLACWQRDLLSSTNRRVSSSPPLACWQRVPRYPLRPTH